MKLGEHLNSLLLNMCDDVTVSRMSLRTVLDICSKHIRNSNCDPPFSYIRKLVRLVMGSLSQVHIKQRIIMTLLLRSLLRQTLLEHLYLAGCLTTFLNLVFSSWTVY